MGFTYRSASPVGPSNVGGTEEISHILVSCLSVAAGEFVWVVLLIVKRIKIVYGLRNVYLGPTSALKASRK